MAHFHSIETDTYVMSSHKDNDDDSAQRRRPQGLSHAAHAVRRSGPPLVPEAIATYLPGEMPADPREAAQLLREFEARAGSYMDTKLAWTKAQRDGDPLRVKAARRLARNWSRPLAAYIEAEAQKAKGKRGPKDIWQSAYNALGADALAYHTVSAILHVLITRLASEGRNRPVHATAISRAIGREIATAARLAAWAKMNPALFDAYQRRLNKAGATPRHRDEVLAIGLNKKARNLEIASPEFLEATEPWPDTEQARIGRWLLIVSEKVTKGAIRLRRRTEGRKSIKAAPYIVELSPTAVEWLHQAVEVQALRSTRASPMICPPRPWHGPRNGGFLLGDDLRFDITRMVRGIPPLVKAIENDLSSKDALRSAGPVFAAINVLQDTPFAVSEAVHDIAIQAAAADLKLDDLPASYRLERVPKAPPTGATEADRTRHLEWRRKQAEVENRNARNISKALWSQSVLAEAAELRELEMDGQTSNGPFYFVERCDSRSRMYPAGTALNQQGSDLARSLLRFERGKPIGDDRGGFWLAAQVAKAFGRDKASWDDRVAWTHTNEDMLRRIASDPFGNRQLWEHESDKLWAALAAAQEWASYLDSGRSPSFITTLPIFVDGTCNGLQHYGALSGDAELARLVNLAPGDKPQDIYREVAEEALRDIKMKAERGTMADRRAAHLWLRIIGDEPPRKLAKKITMTKPYGGTFSVILEEVRAFFDEHERQRRDEWGRSVDDQEAAHLRGWLEKRMEAALKGRTASADRIMEWLQGAMRLLCDHGVADRMDFRTPAGFPWKNLYYGHTKQKVKLTVDGTKHAMTLASNATSTFNRKDAVAAIAPNFVHGLDAAAMQLAICEAKAYGVNDMMAIHDAVGGLACDMDVIAEAVRVGFVKCHQARPLEHFRDAVLLALPDDEARSELRPLPPRGQFNVGRVRSSNYFFC